MSLRLAVALGLLLVSAEALADAEDARKERCATSYEGGQRQRSDGKLLVARDELRVCARDCSPTLGKQCLQWLEELEREIPTILLRVEGSDRTDVRVFLDAAVIREALDGLPIEVDPGPHTVRFVSHDGKSSVERSIVVRSGERLHSIALPLTAALVTTTPRPHAEARRPFPWYSGVAAGFALVGAAVGTGLFVSGRVIESELASSRCAPFCDPSKVEPIDLRYQAGAIAIGVSAVSLALTLLTYALRPTRYDP